MSFKQLNLSNSLLEALSRKGYTTPTPIQQQCIPHVLEGRDLFGGAQTGTGKTAAFSLPLIQLIAAKKSAHSHSTIKALILAPTRELALQISDCIKAYGQGSGLKHTVIFGGVSQHHQVNALKAGVDILVATPGRLLDLVQQGFVKLNAIEHFVLDEADRMLDMGFIHDIKKIIAKLPVKKQTLFFSATLSPEIKSLSHSLLRNPVYVSVAPVSSSPDLIDQSVYYVQKESKKLLLRHLLKDPEIEHVLVFTRTKHGADKVAKDLNRNGINADSIHGNKSQGARERAMKGFKNRTIRVLVATDIASRGIDVKELSHVINYELPEVAETYVHRIGRTGRAGSQGSAFSFCSSEERAYLKDITKLMNKKINVVESHPFA
jgi:ATP-dependent RNA helicase RhlE